jgi:hypothetical protein
VPERPDRSGIVDPLRLADVQERADLGDAERIDDGLVQNSITAPAAVAVRSVMGGP